MGESVRNLKLIVQYDGSGFHGFQMQPSQRTVQGDLQNVLERITDGPVKQYMAGRTDTGVHALGQVVSFRTASTLDAARLKKGINALLPDDIQVKSVADVADEFHARFSAKSRTYIYVILNCSDASPFLGRYALHVSSPLDTKNMFCAAALLEGERDFSSFRAAGDETRHSIRHIFSAGGWVTGERIYLHFTANAFLQHMIRNIVGTLLLVGRGKTTADEFQGIIDAKDRSRAGPTVSPAGLYFCRVIYGEV